MRRRYPPRAFLGSAERGPFLRPGRRPPRAPARSRGQGWPQATARACAARSVLDGGEHGATLDQEAHRLDIQIDFAPGARFACPTCGAADCPVHDTERMSWRHLNFFQHQA